jgi:hypothetical protein
MNQLPADHLITLLPLAKNLQPGPVLTLCKSKPSSARLDRRCNCADDADGADAK